MKSKTTLHFSEVEASKISGAFSERRTSNIELRTSNAADGQCRFGVRRSAFGVRCFHLLLFVILTSCSKEKPANPDSKTTDTTSAVSTNPAAVDGPRPLQFPKDEGVHAEFPFEWWYLNSQFT